MRRTAAKGERFRDQGDERRADAPSRAFLLVPRRRVEAPDAAKGERFRDQRQIGESFREPGTGNAT